MDERTLTALKDSIAHWKRMATGAMGPNEEPDGDQCALCTAFPSFDCFGCPVRDRVGKPRCDDTPYFPAAYAAGEFGICSPEFRAAAKVELEFLQSLLPKDAQP